MGKLFRPVRNAEIWGNFMDIEEEIINERILNGEFSNETIKYMTDEEAANILLKEQENN